MINRRASVLSDDTKRKMRQIAIHTKRQLRGMLVGDTRSAQKGIGFEFDQIREYQVGDDVRCIDWNATSRTGTVLIKQYTEERSRVIFLAVDVSASALFGSHEHTKRDRWNEIASVFALVAGRGNDLVGLILFTDTVELYIPPRRGAAHMMEIMEQLFSYVPRSKKTRYSTVFQYLLQLKKKQALVFVISDFIDQEEMQKEAVSYAKVASRMCDIIAVRCLDQRERSLVPVGFLHMEDIETGSMTLVDTRLIGQSWYEHRISEQNRQFRKWGMSMIDIVDTRCMVSDIINFFKRRMRY